MTVLLSIPEMCATKSRMALEKPKMNSAELVDKMIEKGIIIEPHTKEYVEKYLLESNNFLRLCSYRKLYDKYPCGINQGKYINLNFDQLRATAILDMNIRKHIFSMCIDIEHSLKLRILQDFEKCNNDGYELIQDFFKTRSGGKVALDIAKKRESLYLNKLAGKYIYPKTDDSVYSVSLYNNGKQIEYAVDVPIWIMLEMITFGDLISFYKFFYPREHTYVAETPIPENILFNVKNMRNACAHNNCILATLYKKTKKIDPRMRAFIDSLDIDIGNDGKKTRLKCRIISEIVCVLYSLKELASQDVASYDFQEFSNVLKHFEQKYIHHFAQNSLVFANFIFFKKVVDKLASS